MSRRGIAVGVIALWIAGLLMLARRQTVQSPLDRMLEASLKVAPASYYYTVNLNGLQIGAAMSTLDTVEKRVVVSEMFTGRYPVGNDTLAMTIRSNAIYSRALLLRGFEIRMDGDLNPGILGGDTMGDTILLVGNWPTRNTVQQGKDSMWQKRYRLSSPLFTATFAPIVGMLTRERHAGDTIRVSMFDPLSREVKLVTIQVYEDSVFHLADSAILNRATGEWTPAGEDTVRAQRIGGKGSSLNIWVDRGGRIVAANEPGGLSLTRAPFEVAFKRRKTAEPVTGARQ